MKLVTKPVTTWRYHLPNERPLEGWAIVFLDSIGCFACLSDYGDYGYRWPEAGWSNPQERDFRQAFLSFDDGYILRKLARRDEYDGEATAKNIRRHICEMRREGAAYSPHSRAGAWTKQRARDEWNLLKRHDDVSGREFFAFWYQDTTIQDCAELAVYDIPKQAVAFVERVMGRLREAIRADLRSEGKL